MKLQITISSDEQLSISICNLDEGSPKEVFMEFHKCVSRILQAEFDGLLKFYKDDLTSSRVFIAELDLWQNYWCSENCMAITEKLNTPEDALKSIWKKSLS